MNDEPKPIDDGGPAYPWERSTGMSLRDYFAAAAMQGLIHEIDPPINDGLARLSYSMADAMLRARKEGAL
jgi:hypothetical protein